MDIVKTLDTLNAAFGPSGIEDDIREVLKEMSAPYVDEMTTDSMGNLICLKKGKTPGRGKKIMYAAHMDSIGFIVTHIEDSGMLRVGMVGWLYATYSIGLPVRFRDGSRGVVYMDQMETAESPKFDRLYIDIGASSREEAEKYVQVGDMAVYDTHAFTTPTGMIVTPYADNRGGCVVLLMMMEMMKETDNDIYFVFTTQEEVGLRGAITSCYSIDPDYGIAIDITYSGNGNVAATLGSSVCGKGAAIKIMDTRFISPPAVTSLLESLAKDQAIPYQKDVVAGGCTDAGVMITSRRGVPTGGISFACKAPHCSQEMFDPEDVVSCVRLCCAFAEHDFT